MLDLGYLFDLHECSISERENWHGGDGHEDTGEDTEHRR